jgi:hypothetical protein
VLWLSAGYPASSNIPDEPELGPKTQFWVADWVFWTNPAPLGMIHGAGVACEGRRGCVAGTGGIVGWDRQFLAVWELVAHPLQSILLWFRGVQALQCRICGRRCSTTS